MYSYQEFIDVQNRIDAGLAALIIITVLLTGLVAASRPARLLLVRLTPALPLPDLPMTAILLVALLVRLLPMFTPPWYDEAFNSAVTGVSFEDLHRVILSDVHPPLSYLVFWVSAHVIGVSPFALRLPSLAFGLLSVLMLYQVAQRCGLSEQVARLAALLLALLPAHIVYSTEGRGYTFLMCIVFYLLLAIMDDKPKRYVLAAILGFVHAQGFIYLACFGLLALYKYRQRWLPVVVLTSAISSLWLPIAFIQSHDVADGWWNPPLSLQTALGWITDVTIGRVLQPLPALFILPAIVAVTAAALWQWRGSKTLLVVLVGIPAVTAAFSFIWGNNVFMARSLLPCGVLVCIVWAQLLTKQPRWLALIAPALLLAVGFQNFDAPVRFDKYLDCGERPIFASSNHLAILAKYYNSGKPIYVWEGGNDTSQWLTDDARAVFGFIPLAQPPPGACVLYQDSPLVFDEGRQYVADLIARYPHTSHLYIDLSIYQLWVYEL